MILYKIKIIKLIKKIGVFIIVFWINSLASEKQVIIFKKGCNNDNNSGKDEN